MSVCRVISCVVGRGCLLWPVCSLGKTLLAFALLHSVLQDQICLLLQVFLDILLLHSSPLWWGGHLFLALILESLVGLHHRTVQLLQHYWSRHRVGLLWYWVVCLGINQRSFCCFWVTTKYCISDSFSWLWGLLHFFKGILAHSRRYNGYLNYIHPFHSILVHRFLKCWCSLLPSPVGPLPICLDSWT